MAENTDAKVVERRDVTDLSTNEEVEDEVDDMLSVDDDDDDEVSSNEESLGNTEVEVSSDLAEDDIADRRVERAHEERDVADAAEEIDHENFDFENQEWTLDNANEPKVIDVRGTKLLLQEPEADDDVLNTFEEAADGSRDEQMFGLANMVVQKPELTQEKWDDMSFGAKLSISSSVATYLGIDEGFLDA